MLFLEKFVNREILKFDSFKSYFLSEKFSEARAKRLKKHYNDLIGKLYLTLYQAALSVFIIFNKVLQSEASLIHDFHSEQQRFLIRLCRNSIQPYVTQELNTREECFHSRDIFVLKQLR